MSYTITSTNPSNSAIIVQDQQINGDTNLTFVGKNYSGYGPIIAEDFLHLLENFANSNPPNQTVGGQSIEGQLWYDKGQQQLNVYDGTQWNPVGSIKKATIAPTTAINGDIWVDTTNHQVYVYSGSIWLLVGPQFSAGSETGAKVLPVVDTDNITHNVTAMYSDGILVSIISNAAFTPKTTILGFPNVYQGVTLNSINASSTTAPTKFWGRASEADALNVNGTTVSSSNFLRSDIVSITNQPIGIRSDNGISIGSDLSFTIGSSSSAVGFTSNTSNRGLKFLLKNINGVLQTAMYLNANARVGIGPNNISPATALDIAGVVTIKNDTVSSPNINAQLVVTGNAGIINENSGLLDIAGASITTAGGIAVEKGLFVGGTSIINGQIKFNKLDTNSQPIAGSVIVPGSVEADGFYDIGSESLSFNRIYASTFGKQDSTSVFQGIFTGTFDGPVNGSSTSLKYSTTFKLAGDVTSDNISFSGAGGTLTFTTAISPTLISSKTEATDTNLTDYLLISRTTTNPLTNTTNTILRKTSKQSFISTLPTVPIGAIFPFAGITIPAGYLLCDGSEVQISKYSSLFAAIQYAYKASALLIGYNTFALPDLRGRFPLGADNMFNNLTVPSKGAPDIQISAGGGSANRITDVTADRVGAGAGAEKQVLTTQNLPDHTHNMSSGNNQYYAVGAPNVSDSSAIAGYGLSSTSNTGYGYQYSGNVVSDRLAQPVSTVNPYLTINYIIFTGVYS